MKKLLTILLLATVLTSCNNNDKELLGKWTAHKIVLMGIETNEYNGCPYTYEFTKKEFTLTYCINGTQKSETYKYTTANDVISYNGNESFTYSLENDTLKIYYSLGYWNRLEYLTND
jgi:hypothetical protein